MCWSRCRCRKGERECVRRVWDVLGEMGVSLGYGDGKRERTRSGKSGKIVFEGSRMGEGGEDITFVRV